MTGARRQWQSFASHKLRRVSFQNRCYWHQIDAAERDRARRAVGDCRCYDCRVMLALIEDHPGELRLPGFDA